MTTSKASVLAAVDTHHLDLIELRGMVERTRDALDDNDIVAGDLADCLEAFSKASDALATAKRRLRAASLVGCE